MKCPACQSVMKCITPVNPIPNIHNWKRVDLHCSNRNNYKEIYRCKAMCHMGVIVEPYKEWRCHEYNFEFRYNDKSYFLRGHDYAVDPKLQHRPSTYRRTALGIYIDNKIEDILVADFIMLPTGEDMDGEAWDLFYKLKRLRPQF